MKIIKPHIRLDEFFERLKNSEHSFLLLDYDGTLAPLIPDRLKAFPYPGVQDRLKVLQNSRTNFMILSGRMLSELSTLLNLKPSPELWGSHGGEHLTADGTYHAIHLDTEAMQGLKKAQEACVDNLERNCYEIKPISVAIHWRGIDEEQKNMMLDKITPLWKKIVASYPLEWHEFNGGIELRPLGVNKGAILKKILFDAPGDAVVAYLGDDKTDEEAFEILGDRGLKVLVQQEERPTLADIAIIPPEELFSFLDRWIENVS